MLHVQESVNLTDTGTQLQWRVTNMARNDRDTGNITLGNDRDTGTHQI